MQTDPHNSASQEKFLRTLSASLHQMAQPLSIIQASLELALLSPTTAEQYQRDRGKCPGAVAARGGVHAVHRAAGTVSAAGSGCAAMYCSSVVLEEVISRSATHLDTAQLQLLVLPLRARAADKNFTDSFAADAFLRAAGGAGLLPTRRSREHRNSGTGGSSGAADQALSCQQPGGASHPAASDDTVDRALALADAIVTSAGGEFKREHQSFADRCRFPGAAREQSTAQSTKQCVRVLECRQLAAEFALTCSRCLDSGDEPIARRPMKEDVSRSL